MDSSEEYLDTCARVPLQFCFMSKHHFELSDYQKFNLIIQLNHRSMKESEINNRFKRKIKIVKEQNIFDWELYNNCINSEIPLIIRIGYGISMLDISSELLEYFISRSEGSNLLF